jgi:phage baseplate assembly protein V
VKQIEGVHRAVVTDVRDKEGLGRVQVKAPDVAAEPTWAPLATLMAGDRRGTWFVPDVGDEVLVAFEAGDPRRPVVIGSLWSAQQRPPESMDSAGANAARLIRTRSGLEVRLDDAAGRVTVSTSDGASITLEHGNVTIQTPGTLEIEASKIKLGAGQVEVEAGMAKFAGVVECNTLIATSVVASSYTPGAGNQL